MVVRIKFLKNMKKNFSTIKVISILAIVMKFKSVLGIKRLYLMRIWDCRFYSKLGIKLSLGIPVINVLCNYYVITMSYVIIKISTGLLGPQCLLIILALGKKRDTLRNESLWTACCSIICSQLLANVFCRMLQIQFLKTELQLVIIS